MSEGLLRTIPMTVIGEPPVGHENEEDPLGLTASRALNGV